MRQWEEIIWSFLILSPRMKWDILMVYLNTKFQLSWCICSWDNEQRLNHTHDRTGLHYMPAISWHGHKINILRNAVNITISIHKKKIWIKISQFIRAWRPYILSPPQTEIKYIDRSTDTWFTIFLLMEKWFKFHTKNALIFSLYASMK